jgi:hypothetical protein
MGMSRAQPPIELVQDDLGIARQFISAVWPAVAAANDLLIVLEDDNLFLQFKWFLWQLCQWGAAASPHCASG